MKLKKTIITVLASALVSLSLAACGSGTSDSGDGAYPSKDLDWTIAFGPGGGNDRLSRQIVDILQKQDMYPHKIKVENREGGSGATGWGYLHNQKGTGYGIATTSGSFITTPLQADTGWNYESFTPVGSLVTEDSFFIVNGKSQFKTWEDWVAYAKKKGTVVVGGAGLIQINFILQKLLASAEGYEIKYVPFNDQGQLDTALLSNAIDATFGGAGEVMGQLKAGKMRALLWTGPEPVAEVPDVPTAESLGYEGLPSQPYGLVLPPDAPEEAQEWWIDTMKKVVATPEWQEFITKQYFSANLMWGDDFTEYLSEVNTTFKDILTKEGAL